MALIKCPECRKKISDKCGVCPNCGYPIKENEDIIEPQINIVNEEKPQKVRKRINKKLLIGITAIIVVLLIVGGILGYNALLPIINTTKDFETESQTNFETESQTNFETETVYKHTSENTTHNTIDTTPYNTTQPIPNTNVPITNTATPTEKEYTDFICDFYNKLNTLNEGYYTYSLEKHAYQFHLGTAFMDSYKFLSGNDISAAYRMHDEVYNDLYTTFIKMSLKWSNELEYTFGYKVTIEVISPINDEVLFIACEGNPLYCAYFEYRNR